MFFLTVPKFGRIKTILYAGTVLSEIAIVHLSAMVIVIFVINQQASLLQRVYVKHSILSVCSEDQLSYLVETNTK